MSSGRHKRSLVGFTYLMLLWWMAIAGVMLAALGQRWSFESRRQHELELVFRGQQYAQALISYAKATPDGQSKAPVELAELLADQRSGQLVRHLRQLWLDPITGLPFGLVQVDGRIMGVHSTSEAKPISAPSAIEAYSQWVFDASSIREVAVMPPSGNSSATP